MGGSHGKWLPKMSPAVDSWRRRTEKLVRFLEEVNELSSPHGQEWVRGMQRYYGTRARAMLRLAPPGAQKLVTTFEERLSRV